MSTTIDKYPDVLDILRPKAEGRREFRGLWFGEKLALLDTLRVELAPINSAR